MASSLFDRNQQINSRLKAWLSFQPHAATITAHLANGYQFNSGDLDLLMRMVDLQYELHRYSERGIGSNICKLTLKRMPVSFSHPDTASEPSFHRRVALPSWLRSTQVEPQPRHLANLDGHSVLLSELVGESSRLVQARESLASTTMLGRDPQIAHFNVLSHCRTVKGIIASAVAVSERAARPTGVLRTLAE